MQQNLLVRANRPSSNHGGKAQRQSTQSNNPRVRNHQAVHESRLHHLPGRQTNDANAKTSVQESVVQVFPLKQRHSAILSRLAVENGVDRHQRAAKDGTANKQLAESRSARHRLLSSRGLLVI